MIKVCLFSMALAKLSNKGIRDVLMKEGKGAGCVCVKDVSHFFLNI